MRQCLQERLDRLRASYAHHDELARQLERFVRNAPDDQFVRVNPIQYAADHGRNEAQVIDLFLHARKAGLLTMEWLYACRGCWSVIESFHLLNAAGEHAFCKTGSISRSVKAPERRALSEKPPGFKLGGFLSGSRLLSTQTFLDLFPSETVMSGGGLAVKRVAVLGLQTAWYLAYSKLESDIRIY